MSKAKDLGAGSSFGQARPVSARRAAIGAATVAPTAGVPDPTELPVGRISQNPDNPREQLRDLDGLADSIREIGLVNAITIASVEAYLRERPDRADDLDPDTRYIVIDGHRRLAAAKLAGVPTIRVSVDNALVSTDEALLEAAFVANVHRDDMNPLEQANALKKLVEFYGSQNRAAKRLGIAQSTISSKLSVLDLTPELQADLVEGRRKVEHVRNLSKYTGDQQREQADARAAAAEERREATRRAAELSRRDSSSMLPDLTPSDSTSAIVALARGQKAELYPQPDPDEAADLSRRDNSTPEADLSRRDTPRTETAPAHRPSPARDTDLSRRDNSTPEADLSRRDKSAGDPDPVHGSDLPAPRPEAHSGPGARPVVKMPWNDGVACAEIAISRMTPAERGRMLARLQEEAAREATRTEPATAD
ncbi:ParB/RepB/Spo0J family partition protein [Streptomyces sp. TLI_146]|uniref:ParB/RepB/Spo0J family partition protein n=1 Tax=Streptomyces sp. TLI_146 TaxID=1938858 RepID=UPI000CB91CB6|nr:ParB/RepB/Spo0J family partition protein [Streptomyces sp. TLI_146]PKV76969.1 ParB family chromosome partitioning protein [Streptomyces sp. TLI_146]